MHNKKLLNRFSTSEQSNFTSIKTIFLGVASIILVSCGGSSTSTSSTDAITGSWKSLCESVAPNSGTLLSTNVKGRITQTADIYAGVTDCSGSVASSITKTFSYTLGGNVTVNSASTGISSATKINITDTTVGSLQSIAFDIVAISKDGKELFMGDTTAPNDGSSDKLRPTELDAFFPLFKQ